MNVNVLNQTGKKVKDLALNEEIFGIEPNQQVVYDVVNAQRAAMRQGTHDTLNRTEVRGGGKKPWKQKGTGRARQGSINAPQWRHGGVVFGPTPRSYEVKVNKKVRQLGLKSALSFKALNNKLTALDGLKFDSIKTKNFNEFLNNIKVEGKTLVIVKDLTTEVCLSARNLANVYVAPCDHVSVLDILSYDNLVMTTDAIKYFEEVLA
jgi:large subunit ribosomal protein L4